MAENHRLLYRRPLQQALVKVTVNMIQKIEKANWPAFLDFLSKALIGKRAEIEVASLRLGDQIEAEWVPLLGIRYDPSNDVVVIELVQFEHVVPTPRELYFDEKAGQWAALEIVDAEGARHILQLKDPLMLPAPYSDKKKGQ
jgi:hypothetical protein